MGQVQGPARRARLLADNVSKGADNALSAVIGKEAATEASVVNEL